MQYFPTKYRLIEALDFNLDRNMACETASEVGNARVSDQTFEIMKLPKEVRRMILKEYLLMSGPVFFNRVVIVKCGTPGKRKRIYINGSFALAAKYPLPQDRSHPAFIEESRIIRQFEFFNIFLVSRTIYNESMPIYFGQNLFSFHSTDNFANFVTRLGPNCRWQLGRIYICWHGSAPAKAARLLGECFGLRHLTIQVLDGNYTCCDRQVPYETRLLGMKDLLRVRGLTKVEVVIPSLLRCYCPRHRNNGSKWTNIAGSEGIAAMIRHLEVLKQPIDPEKIKRYVKGYSTKFALILGWKC